MTKKKSLEQAFIKKYGKALNFSEKDIQEVLHKTQSQPQRPAKKRIKIGPPLMMIAAPLIAAFLILSSNALLTKENQESPGTEKDTLPVDNEQEFFGDFGMHKAIQEGLFTKVDQTVEKNGTSITIHELLYDGSRFAVVLSVKGKNAKDERGFPNLPDFSLSINDSPYIGGYSGTYTNEKYKYLYEFDFKEDLPDKFKLKIEVGMDGTEEKWDFELPVKKAGKSYYQVAPHKTASNGEVSMTLDKVSFAPSGTQIVITTNESVERYNTKSGTYIFAVKDEKGQVIPHMMRGSKRGGEKDGMFADEFINFYEPVTKQPKTLTITPYLQISSKSKPQYIEIPLKQEMPIFLKQDSYGGIRINKIEHKKDQLLLYYQLEGEILGRESVPLLKENSSEDSIAYGSYLKTAEGYVAKFKTSKPVEELTVIAEKRNINRVEGLELTVQLDK